ncbi:MAG TPA: bifunctional oligoribonuclease/PAP phosphatase NrnA [Symbiobacteriaceae bacterium]|nr:bifunctional oligoribonuclease/PAP phosphatase NrnA [Symbiobacteriaceae bacterium]
MSSNRLDAAGAAHLIAESDSILVFYHVSPDGDCIGSTLGMVHALKKAGKRVQAVGADPVPRIYDYMPGCDTLFVPWAEVEGEWDLALILDCGDLDRVGAALPVVRKAKRTLNVDHHITNDAFGDDNYLDFTAAATGELVYLIIRELGVPVDFHIATCLYTAIAADTGGFKYDNSAPRTFRIAADLVEAGARPYEIASAIWENESMARLSLLSQALSTLQVDPTGQIAWISVTREMLDRTGASEEDVDGLVNYARKVAGVEVGLLFRECPDGRVRCGLRSRRQVDVGTIAKQFGGGGHARAAGCGVGTDIEEARHQVLSAVRAVI